MNLRATKPKEWNDLQQILQKFEAFDDTQAGRAPLLDWAVSNDVTPAEMLLVAAEQGWLPAEGEVLHEGATLKDVVACLRPQAFHLCQLRESHIPQLLEIEKACWSEALQTPIEQLTNRVRQSDQDHFGVVIDDALIGVIYAQRIPDTDALTSTNMDDVDTLYDANGETLQLLAISVLPAFQDRGLGDHLLDFRLNLAALTSGISSVVAVTLCAEFSGKTRNDLIAYVDQKTPIGTISDPILRFHELHGAQVIGLVNNYRVRDLRNLGYGVLIRYDLAKRKRRAIDRGGKAPVPVADISDIVTACVRNSLGDAADKFDLDTAFLALGLESSGIMALADAVSDAFGQKISAALLFRHNSARKLIEFLKDTAPVKAGSVTPNRSKTDDPHIRTEDIAIIGMSCRLPGDINTPEDLWQLLNARADVIGQRPPARWPKDLNLEGAAHPAVNKGGFLSDPSRFDADFFRIAPIEAAGMDPQQRIMLELSWHAFEDAGIVPTRLAGSDVGVFVGVSGSDYQRCLDAGQTETTPHHGTGNAASVIANRISYFYGFEGPSAVIDTACSSSLVALHHAVGSLRNGEARLCLVGGINLILHPSLSVTYAKAGMLSPDGLCKTFDAGANGYVRSEGGIAVVLKRLKDALRDGDSIAAVIKGTSSNHAGQSDGLTVPSPDAQGRLLAKAWKDAEIGPDAISYFEAHGTGTPLGDPIEIEGIKHAIALAGGTRSDWHCGIGSIKSNLGHLEAAAGLAGVLKTVLSMRHGEIPATLNFQSLNPEIELDGSGLSIAQNPGAWPTPLHGAPMAGVSSFGSGGSNAHTVIAAPPSLAKPERVCDGQPHLVALSAKTPERLLAVAQSYIRWLSGKGASCNLSLLSHWSLHRRAAQDTRFIAEVTSQSGLIAALQSYVDDQAPLHVSDDSANYDVARDWSAGKNVAWTGLENAGALSGLRLDLPPYPFAETQHWALPEGPGTSDDKVHAQALAPSWSPVNAASLAPLADDAILVAGPFGARLATAFGLKGAQVLPPTEMPKAKHVKAVRQILWVSEPHKPATYQEDLVALHRFVRALDQSDSVSQLTVITWNGACVTGHDLRSAGAASILAFSGSLSEERPDWSVTCLDLELSTLEAPCDLMLPNPLTSKAVAYRNGTWHRQQLVPIEHAAPQTSHMREGGVYVVIGGAGGLGIAWTRHVLASSRATIIWLGRRRSVKTKIKAASVNGQQPDYIRCNASRPAQLAKALTSIHAKHQHIDGIILATLGPADAPILDTSDEHFAQMLEAKADVALATLDAVKPFDPSFVLMFSSIMALENPGGYGGYAAGSAFMDAYARIADKETPYPIRTINWGHWDKGAAATLTEATQTRLAKQGVHPITIADAVPFMDHVLNDPLVQVAALKWSDLSRHPLVDLSRCLRAPTRAAAAPRLPALQGGLSQRSRDLSGQGIFACPDLEDILICALKDTLDNAPLPDRDQTPDYLRRWRAATDRLLTDVTRPQPDWRARLSALKENDKIASAVDLAEICLAALPDILSGHRTAPSVMFPDASMSLVEPVYRDLAASRHMNHVLAQTLHDDLSQRDGPIRVLELGAGTGGTTAQVIPMLADLPNLERYEYTDISHAFLMHGQDSFGALAPYLTTSILDITTAPEDQGFAPRRFDAVVATNVLHATPDMHRTLRHAKTLLKPGGRLWLNEITGFSIFAHTTFGLLEGWWAPRDGLRIPGSPLVSLQGWRSALTEVGFLDVTCPTETTADLGQDIIAATSDGWVHTKITTKARQETPKPAGTPHTDIQHDHKPVEQLLRTAIAEVLRLDPQQLKPDEPLSNYGLDSILITQITARLRQDIPDLDATLLFQHQTISGLSTYLAEQHSVPKAVAAVPIERPQASGDIAIVGMAFEFPQGRTAHEFWQLLSQGTSAITEIPEDRWPLENHYEPDPDKAVDACKSYCKWGGFLDGVTEFDPLFFGISPKEAGLLDPQERRFLQIAWNALENAGITREHVRTKLNRRLGVFAGITRTGFDMFGPQLWTQGKALHPHTSFSSVANRLSFFLDASGPSLPVDTMCSSSLTAIHQACESLQRGECDAAIAGGVNIYTHPSSYAALSAMRMLSPDGLCRSFGAGANGFVPGEGVAALILRPLKEARAHGDRIHAVIKSTAVNHGGRTNGYTVPNPRAQADLVRDAINKSHMRPDQISYVEAHGTGTALGDPIEISGLANAMGGHVQRDSPCAIGSVKTNIGHLEAAAGIAGIIKVVLQMRHQQLVPSLHSDDPHPDIPFAKSGFKVQQALEDWTSPDGVLRAGVSSFGAGGANAHVVLEKPQNPPPVVEEDTVTRAFPISAQSQNSLRAYCQKLIHHLELEGDKVSTRDIAFTLQTGREPMAHRVAIVANSITTLRQGLKAYLTDTGKGTVWFDGAQRIGATEGQDVLQGIATYSASELAQHWVAGTVMDWQELYPTRGSGRPEITDLPGYAFDTQKYWLPIEPERPETPVQQSGKLRLTGLNDTGPVETPKPVRKKVSLVSLDPPVQPSPVRTQRLEGLEHVAHVTLLRANGSVAAMRDHLNQAAQTARTIILSGETQTLLSIDDIDDLIAACPVPVVVCALPTTKGIAARDMAHATSLAEMVSGAPRATLMALKQHLAPPTKADQDLMALRAKWTQSYDWGATPAPPSPGRDIPLATGVVALSEHPNGVVQLTLSERHARNTFTPDFVAGVYEAFDLIDTMPECKAVVLTGFDTFFACGGTKQGLLDIQAGRAKFTDEISYAKPLLCKVPVIAAMQGHAVGAGWVMGLNSDVAIYAEEASYQSPYMHYGFSPGAGATWLFPAHFGDAAAADILFTARKFSGGDIRSLAPGIPVFKRAEVLARAHGLAQHLARRTRDDLIAQKDAYAAPLRDGLTATYASEQALHEAHLVANPEVANLIRDRFEMFENSQPQIAPKVSDAPILQDVRKSLADELGIDADHIQTNTAFADLGMDSINAVVWVRKLSQTYGVRLSATCIYSHPDISSLVGLITQEMPDHLPDPLPSRAAPADTLTWLQTSLEEELSLPKGRLDTSAQFVDIGLDSVTAVTWIRKLNTQFGLKETGTLVYRHTTLEELADYVAQAAGDIMPSDSPSQDVERAPRVSETDIAIIGMAGRFPQAPDIDTFWTNLIEGRDCVRDIPAERWPIDDYYDPDRRVAGKTVCRRMGALDDIDKFDPLFFGISPAEAELMDPAQRLFLETAWTAIEDSATRPESLAGRKCGVFAGCEPGDYRAPASGGPHDAYALTGASVAMLPARVAYALDLQGPCLSIDTACSASLVAIANACDSLVSGASDVALAGGVYLLTGPDIHVQMSRAGMLSPDGTCYSFDARANGFVPGEGVGVLVLKRLADAQRDGDDICATIRGWSVNQDGKTNGITAPNPKAQTRLQRDVYDRFDIHPAQISLVEAHGTGTSLGDPIEVEALTESFGSSPARCALGSVKSNIGHLATAAGVAGTIKAALALERQIIPPTIHYQHLNPNISLDETPFYIATDATPWPAQGGDMAAVSSFGFSGTNAHIVLARATETASNWLSDTVMLPLSARSIESLKTYARAVQRLLTQDTRTPFGDIAYTYQCGRAEFE